MVTVVDTSVLIDHLRGHEQARAALRGAAEAGERFVASVLTKVEVLAGMRASEEDATRRLLERLDWVSVDDERLARRYLASHPGVDPVDYVIAATTQHLGAELWTRNLRHFPMFPELRAPY